MLIIASSCRDADTEPTLSVNDSAGYDLPTVKDGIIATARDDPLRPDLGVRAIG
jgi:hypothetical protein